MERLVLVMYSMLAKVGRAYESNRKPGTVRKLPLLSGLLLIWIVPCLIFADDVEELRGCVRDNIDNVDEVIIDE